MAKARLKGRCPKQKGSCPKQKMIKSGEGGSQFIPTGSTDVKIMA
jgi:hypothetical protein